LIRLLPLRVRLQTAGIMAEDNAGDDISAKNPISQMPSFRPPFSTLQFSGGPLSLCSNKFLFERPLISGVMSDGSE